MALLDSAVAVMALSRSPCEPTLENTQDEILGGVGCRCSCMESPACGHLCGQTASCRPEYDCCDCLSGKGLAGDFRFTLQQFQASGTGLALNV